MSPKNVNPHETLSAFCGAKLARGEPMSQKSVGEFGKHISSRNTKTSRSSTVTSRSKTSAAKKISKKPVYNNHDSESDTENSGDDFVLGENEYEEL